MPTSVLNADIAANFLQHYERGLDLNQPAAERRADRQAALRLWERLPWWPAREIYLTTVVLWMKFQ